MNYLPLFLVYNPPHETFSEKLSLAGEMLLRGMGTVFLVLIVLWGIIELFSYAFTAGERSGKSKEAEKTSQPVKKTESVPTVSEEVASVSTEEEAVEETPTVDDGAVVAAIMAAIEAYRREEGTYNLPYRVVSFKRKNTKNSRG